MNILLAADGSDFTKRAARFLAGHVAQYASPPKVFVLYVHGYLPYGNAAAVVGKKAIREYEGEVSEKALGVARKVLDRAGVAYEAEWMVGDVAPQVKAFVKREAIDLIVMGSHGHGAFASFALGSTAARLLATVKTPVVIVR